MGAINPPLMPCRTRNAIRESADELKAHSRDEKVNQEKQVT
jgi:hypothetical protein